MLVDYQLDDEGNLVLVLARELWEAMIANDSPEFRRQEGSLVMVKFSQVEGSYVLTGGPSHLEPPCPP